MRKDWVWKSRLWATGGVCPYCGVKQDFQKDTEDHRIACVRDEPWLKELERQIREVAK